MNFDFTKQEKATFSAAQKDLFSIVQKFIENKNLNKLLYYQTKDALKKEDLTSEQTVSLIHKNIRVVPKLPVEEEENSYIIITFDSFVTNANNPEFRDNVITFDIICHLDNWLMENYQLRPYMIMGEIDKMLNKKKLNGIGTVNFLSANQLLLSSELAGYSLMYTVVNDAE